jgi:hypothetical protein
MLFFGRLMDEGASVKGASEQERRALGVRNAKYGSVPAKHTVFRVISALRPPMTRARW